MMASNPGDVDGTLKKASKVPLPNDPEETWDSREPSNHEQSETMAADSLNISKDQVKDLSEWEKKCPITFNYKQVVACTEIHSFSDTEYLDFNFFYWIHLKKTDHIKDIERQLMTSKTTIDVASNNSITTECGTFCEGLWIPDWKQFVRNIITSKLNLFSHRKVGIGHAHEVVDYFQKNVDSLLDIQTISVIFVQGAMYIITEKNLLDDAENRVINTLQKIWDDFENTHTEGLSYAVDGKHTQEDLSHVGGELNHPVDDKHTLGELDEVVGDKHTQEDLSCVGGELNHPVDYKHTQEDLSHVGRELNHPVGDKHTQEDLSRVGGELNHPVGDKHTQEDLSRVGGELNHPVDYKHTQEGLSRVGGELNHPVGDTHTQEGLSRVGGELNHPVGDKHTQEGLSCVGGELNHPVGDKHTQEDLSRFGGELNHPVGDKHTQEGLSRVGGELNHPVGDKHTQEDLSHVGGELNHPVSDKHTQKDLSRVGGELNHPVDYKHTLGELDEAVGDKHTQEDLSCVGGELNHPVDYKHTQEDLSRVGGELNHPVGDTHTQEGLSRVGGELNHPVGDKHTQEGLSRVGGELNHPVGDKHTQEGLSRVGGELNHPVGDKHTQKDLSRVGGELNHPVDYKHTLGELDEAVGDKHTQEDLSCVGGELNHPVDYKHTQEDLSRVGGELNHPVGDTHTQEGLSRVGGELNHPVGDKHTQEDLSRFGGELNHQVGDKHTQEDLSRVGGELNHPVSDKHTQKDLSRVGGELNHPVDYKHTQEDLSHVGGELNHPVGDKHTQEDLSRVGGELNHPVGDKHTQEDLSRVGGELNHPVDDTHTQEDLSRVGGELNHPVDYKHTQGELDEVVDDKHTQGELDKAVDDTHTQGELDKAVNDKHTQGELDKVFDDKRTQGELDEAVDDKHTQGELSKCGKHKCKKESFSSGEYMNYLIKLNHQQIKLCESQSVKAFVITEMKKNNLDIVFEDEVTVSIKVKDESVGEKAKHVFSELFVSYVIDVNINKPTNFLTNDFVQLLKKIRRDGKLYVELNNNVITLVGTKDIDASLCSLLKKVMNDCIADDILLPADFDMDMIQHLKTKILDLLQEEYLVIIEPFTKDDCNGFTLKGIGRDVQNVKTGVSKMVDEMLEEQNSTTTDTGATTTAVKCHSLKLQFLHSCQAAKLDFINKLKEMGMTILSFDISSSVIHFEQGISPGTVQSSLNQFVVIDSHSLQNPKHLTVKDIQDKLAADQSLDGLRYDIIPTDEQGGNVFYLVVIAGDQHAVLTSKLKEILDNYSEHEEFFPLSDHQITFLKEKKKVQIKTIDKDTNVRIKCSTDRNGFTLRGLKLETQVAVQKLKSLMTDIENEMVEVELKESVSQLLLKSEEARFETENILFKDGFLCKWCLEEKAVRVLCFHNNCIEDFEKRLIEIIKVEKVPIGSETELNLFQVVSDIQNERNLHGGKVLIIFQKKSNKIIITGTSDIMEQTLAVVKKTLNSSQKLEVAQLVPDLRIADGSRESKKDISVVTKNTSSDGLKQPKKDISVVVSNNTASNGPKESENNVSFAALRNTTSDGEKPKTQETVIASPFEESKKLTTKISAYSHVTGNVKGENLQIYNLDENALKETDAKHKYARSPVLDEQTPKESVVKTMTTFTNKSVQESSIPSQSNVLVDDNKSRSKLEFSVPINKLAASDLLSPDGKPLLSSVEEKHNCRIEIDGMSQHGHKSDSVIKNQEMAAWYSPNGVCVVAVKGDMWKMKADVLLCPVHDATQNLQELIPADFLKGEEFSQCQKCVKSLDKKTVEFVQVKNQRCKCLAFTLIPRPQNKNKTVSIDTINQTFKEVMDKNFTSVAFPTTVDVHLVIQCVKDLLCTKSSQQILKNIYILLEYDHELQHLKSVMDKKCNKWDMTDSTVQPISRISVIIGELAKQQVDVLVNSTNWKLDLSHGMVSKSILELAGQQVQDECYRFCPKGIESGCVVKTSSGKLRTCKAIFHGALEEYKENYQYCTSIMESFIYSCLSTASGQFVSRPLHFLFLELGI
ncbi:uncharacterized protein LOC121391262 [Gigantopelta aegis]|uniref:uncharacterized protein LOC121391262 n=1 Tax=Gigantopelta aegis TaxID=1735272 RepID=UPI001B887B2D|nr:uncharacterized protein LOC121391262 [Gigantopelta aegis]